MKRVGFTPIFILLFVYSCLADEPKRRRHEIGFEFGLTTFWEKVKVTDLEKFNQLNPGYYPEHFEKRVKEPTLCRRTSLTYRYFFNNIINLQISIQTGRMGTACFAESSEKETLQNPTGFPMPDSTQLPKYGFYRRSIPYRAIALPIGIGIKAFEYKNFSIYLGINSYWELLKVFYSHDISYEDLYGYISPHIYELESQSRKLLFFKIKPNASWEGPAREQYVFASGLRDSPKQNNAVHPSFASILSVPLTLKYTVLRFVIALQGEFGMSLKKKAIFSDTYPSETRLFFFNQSLQVAFRL